MSDSAISPDSDSSMLPSLDATNVLTWQSYRSPAWGFSIEYPSILTPMLSDTATLVAPLHAELTFTRSSSAESAQLPTLSVRIFDNPDQRTPADWAMTYRPNDPPSAEYTPFSLAGASGVQACTQLMIAPRCAFYLGSQGRIYQLIPYDDIGTQMIERLSFVN